MHHEFSPIITEDRLTLALDYVATSTLALARKILQQELTIDTICFFAQSTAEYTFLLEAVRKRGTESKFSHGPTTYVDTDIEVAGQHIAILGVRQPDPTRHWVGYGDYPLSDDDYGALRTGSNPFIREISSGRGQDLRQFEHPDSDVLGFAFRSADHL